MKTSSSSNNHARIKLEGLQLHHVWVWEPEDLRSWALFVAHYLQLSWQLGGSSCTNTLGHIFVKWISDKWITYGQHPPTPTSGISQGCCTSKASRHFIFSDWFLVRFIWILQIAIKLLADHIGAVPEICQLLLSSLGFSQLWAEMEKQPDLVLKCLWVCG